MPIMSLEYSQEVTDDYEELFKTDEEYDVIIYVGENENMKELHAHSLILYTRSQYFRTAFSNKWIEKMEGKFIFKKPNISPQLFEIILRFIYCGKIDLTILQSPEILKLIIALDELNIQTLIPCIKEYLIKHKDKFLQLDHLEILQHELFTDLWTYCLEKICEDAEMFFNSDKFINLKAPLLESLLKRGDLILDEIVIWNSLLKWGIAQNPSISQDFTKWSGKEITIMERTLHRFIPSIRFYHISSDDFLGKIYPLKKLLPKDLFNDLTIFHNTPNKKPKVDEIPQAPRFSKCNCDSTLIKYQQHFAIFASWIDKKENFHYDIKNIPYSFDLLYRASRDGDIAFHAMCDDKRATIVIVKIKESDQIVGGYNPLCWNSDSSFNIYKSTKDSFIFSIANRNRIQKAKVGYSNNKHSIGCFPRHGPVFGSSDLYCIVSYQNNNANWYSSSGSYPSIDGMPRGDVKVDDYEVFHVIKK